MNDGLMRARIRRGFDCLVDYPMNLVVSDSTTPISFLHLTSLTVHTDTFNGTAYNTRYKPLHGRHFLVENIPLTAFSVTLVSVTTLLAATLPTTIYNSPLSLLKFEKYPKWRK